MSNQKTAQEILELMMKEDHFSKWLGVEVVHISEGSCILEMVIQQDMLNGFGIAHGGITYSLADSALAFASNSHGRKAVSIETSISHLKPLVEGQKIRAEAEVENLGNKIATYSVKVKSDKKELIASFKGTVYRKSENW